MHGSHNSDPTWKAFNNSFCRFPFLQPCHGPFSSLPFSPTSAAPRSPAQNKQGQMLVIFSERVGQEKASYTSMGVRGLKGWHSIGVVNRLSGSSTRCSSLQHAKNAAAARRSLVRRTEHAGSQRAPSVPKGFKSPAEWFPVSLLRESSPRSPAGRPPETRTSGHLPGPQVFGASIHLVT